MAYCVNCGVKLDEALEKCPLCNTPVYRPNINIEKQAESPYPTERGTVEKVRRMWFVEFICLYKKLVVLICDYSLCSDFIILLAGSFISQAAICSDDGD